MASRQRTIRADDRLWRMIEESADSLGVSTSQFVRDSALIRVTVMALEEAGTMADLYRAAERAVRSLLEQ